MNSVSVVIVETLLTLLRKHPLGHSGKLSSGICRYKKPRAKLMRGVESEFGYLG